MTATATKTPPPAAPPLAGKGTRFRFTWPWVLLIGAGALIVIGAVRAVTGAEDITSAGQVAGALSASVPIALAGQSLQTAPAE